MTREDELFHYLKRVTADLRQTKAQLTDLRARDHEPVAVVAMGCRYPGGVRTPEQLWRLVDAGDDAVSGFPTDRGWPLDGAGAGGFLYDAADFDPSVFGISPREALAMDPQQRIALEVAWETFERAGIDPLSLRGSRTAVYLGVMYNDYASRFPEAPKAVAGHLGNGSAASIASGRIAYTLGLAGPAVTLDTACSSSLVALHLAVRALRSGECDLALAGGVTVMSTPATFTEFGHQGGLAADGRCKSFSSAADGTGWSEGAGLLLVERLSDARRLGHGVLAVVRGTAVNSDGASSGLTAPNGPAQQRVILDALADADLAPSDVDMVEAHGTGTRLGDPIEARALHNTYGHDRKAPLWLGSVKSNIGHTQAAAGVAGVIKAVQAIRHRRLPRTVHADEPSPEIDWTGPLTLLTSARPWPSTRTRRAAVSSFGISGTNAHVILEEAREDTDRPTPRDGLVRAGSADLPWLVSAQDDAALRAQAGLLRDAVSEADPGDVAFTLAIGRAALPRRAVVFAPAGLTALATDTPHAALSRGTARSGRTVFVYPGQGAQWVGMGARLLEDCPAFAESIERCADALAPHVDWSLHEVLRTGTGLDRVEVVQPALWAVMIALTDVWRAAGVRPDVVIGHSQGEIAAACVAGILSIEDGARVVALRSGLIARELAGAGRMAAIALPREEIDLPAGVSVAAHNSPSSTVVSGDAAAVRELLDRLRERGVRVRDIPVDYASHSAQVERIETGLRAALATIVPRRGHTPFHSTVTGHAVDGTELTGGYWYRNLRETVRFAEAVRNVAEQAAVFVEPSPHPTLVPAIGEQVEDVAAVGTLHRDDGSPGRLLAALGEAWAAGAGVRWPEVLAGTGRRIPLPTYAFQRRRFWLDGPDPMSTGQDPWCYRTVWQPVTVAPAPLSGRWLLVSPTGSPWVGPVTESVRLAGADVATIAESTDPGWYVDRIAELEPTGIVCLPGGAGGWPGPVPAMLALVQAVADRGGVRLWCLTAGDDPGQAAVRGLGRVAGLEHPDWWGGLVDLPEDGPLDTLPSVLAAPGGEDEFALRDTGVLARRLVRARSVPAGADWRPRGAVLVTGGMGALGRHVVRWLAATGCEHLVLTSRRGPNAPGADELRTELTGAGARVDIEACDVGDRAALAALLARLDEAGTPVTAVFHTAGAGTAAPLVDTTPALLAETGAAKVVGARHLDELLADRPLDAFVLFSSGAGVWGGAGQGAYAAANAYLDALAERRRARGLPGLSIAWGSWAGEGMAGRDGAGEALAGIGLPPMDPAAAISRMARALGAGDTTVVVADIDWADFAPVLTAARPRPLLDGVPEARAALRPEEAPAAGTAWQRDQAALPAAERDRIALELVRAEAAAVLGHDSTDAVAPRRAFRELGVDSLTAVRLRDRLRAATGLALPTTVVFEHPTPADLARFLSGSFLSGSVDGGTEPAGAPVNAPVDDDPIVIVAMGCRFPGGADSPERLWDLVARGQEARTRFPEDRGWDDAAIDAALPDPRARRGGFVADATRFDAGLFGISPREAVAMDPQQRMLLETTWEAFERLGVSVDTLRGSRTGVFVGAATAHYGIGSPNADNAEGHLLTGTSTAVLSGRIAYAYGLVGPAVTLDTACSSSLVALHLAVRSLRAGECSLAVVGGVTVMATPSAFTEFARQGGLAGDGRCKAFAATADGTGWAEGAGVLLVERLSDAQRAGHPVLAVVAGSAMNSDGASNGLSAPSGPAQQRVILDALASAGLRPSDVDVVEAHGTGTTLGDPIEAQALQATYGQHRDRPLWLGAVKSNIGHTQSAAGVAGIIKVVEAMRHGMLPKTLHVTEPTPHVDWQAGAVRLLTERQPWPSGDRVRHAAVSAFGVSGTNAHVILREPPAPEPAPVGATRPASRSDTAPVPPWVVTAHGTAALRARAAALPVAGHDPLDLAYSLAVSRTALSDRAVIVGDDRLAAARALAEGVPHPDLVIGSAADGRLAMVFSGQGSQRPGMGRHLYPAFPVFAEAFDEVCAAVDPHLPRPLREVVFGADAAVLNRTELAQPAIFAVEVALFRLWCSWGITPDVVLGHSIGEITAAHVAGCLTLDDAARLVSTRGALMQALPEGGAMVAVGLPESEATALLSATVTIAAVNGPASVVLSGLEGDLRAVVEPLPTRGTRVSWLPVSHAFHSALMDPMLDAFRSAVAGISHAPPAIPIISTVTGQPVTELTTDHWVRHACDTVRFADAVGRLADARTLLEVGPTGGLVGHLDPESTGRAVASLGREELRTLERALARLVVRGADPDWPAVFAGTGARRVDLPTYPFQREHYWLDAPAPVEDPWCYEVRWIPMAATPTPRLTGSWLVVTPTDADPGVTAVLHALRARGVATRVLRAGEIDRVGVEPAPAGVLSLLALTEDERAGLLDTAALIRAMASTGWSARLWCATRDAVAAGQDTAPAQASVWGLGRSAALEHPRWWGGLVDLPTHLDDLAADRLVTVLAGREDQVAVRESGVLARRLVRTGPAAHDGWTPRGTVLITGGTGALGAHTARHLARAGAEHLLLVSRRGADAPGADRLRAELEGLGAVVTFAACDVADRDALADLLAGIDPAAPLTAVVHTAGAGQFAPLAETGPATFAETLRAKSAGAANLDELLADYPLDAFVMFSSIAATWGSAGQAAYGAANAFLDALAERRRARGLAATSVAWGPWDGGGMAEDPDFAARLDRLGIRLMAPARALRLLDRAVGGPPCVTAADVDWATFLPLFTSARPSPLLADLAEPGGDGADDPVRHGEPAGMTPEQRRAWLLSTVRAETAAVLGHADVAAVPAERAFADLGVDSLLAVELRGRLAAALGVPLPAALVFDYPTPARLVAHLAGELGENHAPAGAVRAGEPIAVVAMACRFPGGVRGPEDLWDLVAAGRDAVTGFPVDRGWDLAALLDAAPGRPGSSTAHAGGFLDDVAGFDAELFGVSPREALAMDPQQRLLLEVCWEAFERAGLGPAALRGSRTGVFVGCNGQDYVSLLRADESSEGYLLTGNTASVTSGRIAYVFGLEGPALTIDTACSSSLVAIHLAIRALRSGECDRALAGGVTVMSTPVTFTEFSKQGGLAADGRCKSFSADADGTGWGEGAGVILLERLTDAQRLGHPVLAVLRGSAINSDGASNGLTAPNGPAQQRVIHDALTNAQLQPTDIDTVEAHGTGTKLGDPIEAQALHAAYGRNRNSPLWLGSIKSNIGHTQAAAGVAGVIKTIQAMRHGTLPKTLHTDRPTPEVDWHTSAVRLLATPVDWPRGDRPRRAGVSSFGISGTNAHLIIEEPAAAAPTGDTPGRDAPPVVPWVLSATTMPALRAHARRLAEVSENADLVDIGHTLATTRAALPEVAVVVGGGIAERVRLLAAFATGRDTPDVVTGRRVDGGLAVAFSGQGTQHPGMGKQLHATFPTFATAFDETCDALDPHLPRPLRDVVFGHDPDTLNRTEYAQPAIFAHQVALYRLWEQWGVIPDVLIGHSIGEITAAHVSGALTLHDAARLITTRAALMQTLPDGGSMVAAALSPAEATELLATDTTGTVGLAAVNGPDSVVLSGLDDALRGLLAERGTRTTWLPVSHAFHSPLMDPVLDAFRATAETVDHAPPPLPVMSTVTGEPIAEFTADHWVRHARDTVRFHDAVARLDGIGTVLEIGANGALTALLRRLPGALGAVASQRGERPQVPAVTTALATLLARGVRTDPAALYPGGQRVDLPTYPFQHQRFWPSNRPRGPETNPREPGHPLLDAEVDLAHRDEVLLTGRLSRVTHPWLSDHTVLGRVVVPGTAIADLAVHAAATLGAAQVTELTLEAPLTVPAAGAVRVQVAVSAPDAGTRTLTVHSAPDGEPWTRHAVGVLSDTPGSPGRPLGGEWPPPGAEAIPVEDVYPRFAEAGIDYGPAFRALRSVWRTGDGVLVEVATDTVEPGFHTHPALLDAVLQAAGVAGLVGDGGLARVPFAWSGLTPYATGGATLRARLAPAGPDGISIRVEDTDGHPVLDVERLVLRAVADRATPGDALLRQRWRPVEVRAGVETTPYTTWHAGADEAAPWAEAAHALDVIQAWLADPAVTDHTLVLVTQHAVAAHIGDPAPNPAHAAVWGLARSAQSEYPGRIVLIDTDGTAESGNAISGALRTAEPQLAIRAGEALVPRLVPEDSGADDLSGWRHGTVLVTGATSTLAGVLLPHLVNHHGVRHLHLLTRDTTRLTLPDLAADITITEGDITNRDHLTQVLNTIPATHPLVAILHLAGATRDAAITDQDTHHLTTAFQAKVLPARHLHDLTRDHPTLTHIVHFSSAAATLGAPGQANYAAANAYLDALAHVEPRTTTVAWGLWELDAGLAATADGATRARMRRSGLSPLTVSHGLHLFDTAIRTTGALVALPVDPPNLPSPAPAVLRALVPARGPRDRPAGFADRWRTLPAARQDAALLDLVRAEAATVLGHTDRAGVAPDRPFQDLGFDSLTSVEFRNRLGAATGETLPATLVFDHPTPVALTAFLRTRLLGDEHRPQRTTVHAAPVDEPIAIIGVACRYPGGVSTPDELWELVRSGTDAVGGFPTDRGWDLDQVYDPDTGVRPLTGGFLYEAAEFDPRPFGISPREAVAMDPQQRLALEVCWEAFEDAGLDPMGQRGSRTAVYLGVMYSDYAARFSRAPREAEGHLGNGSSPSIASGRIAYTFGLEGPALTIDTACSSSLVAIHLATRALRSGECDRALAGGVTVMSTPTTFTEFSKQGGLAADGRCKPFSANADGTGWGEGAGILLMERLSDARRLKHPVLAVLRGSAMNSDGASNGLTAPNGPAQQRVIHDALADAGLRPSDVDVVEAHGTGTTLGDPIEAQALLATYGQDRATPLWLGAIKSNLGHTQAAAGVAGVIKTIQAMRHGTLPKTLHIDRPTEHVDWTAGAVQLLTETTAWPDVARPRRAAVSSFGISGTNAHVILEAPPAAEETSEPPTAPEAGVKPWVLSGHGPAAVRALADRLATHFTGQPVRTGDVARTLARSRASGPDRAVVVADDPVAALASFARDGVATGVLTGRVVDGGLAVAFSGQGTQRPGMGRDLHAAFPVFAAAFDDACAALDPHLPRPLREVVFGDDPDTLDRTEYTQPAIFAHQVALFRLWQDWDLEPGVLVGHSIGEITAAHVSGALTLHDAARLVTTRAALMQALPDGGAMVAIATSPDTVEPLLAGRTTIGLAAHNGPDAVVLSGSREDLAPVVDALPGVRATWLRVSHAFHSPLMDPVLEDLHATAKTLSHAVPTIPVVSTVTGEPVTEFTADHWVRHARDTVRFDDAVAHLSDIGTILEVGTGGALCTLLEQVTPGRALPSLRHDTGEPAALATALARLIARGAIPHWARLLGPGPTTALPTYPFQRTRFWLAGPEHTPAAGLGLDSTGHPLLPVVTVDPDTGTLTLSGRLSARTHPWLSDHLVGGRVMLPGTAFVDLALLAGEQCGHPMLHDLILEAPLVVPEDGAVDLRLTVDPPGDDGRRPVRVHARTTPDAPWTRLATAALRTTRTEPPAPPPAWPPADAVPLDTDSAYPRLADRGLRYGPAFQNLRAAWRHGDEVYAEVALPEDVVAGGHLVHPALLDAALHAIGLGDLIDTGGDRPSLPFLWRDVWVSGQVGTVLRVRLTTTGPAAVALALFDEHGRPVGEVAELTLRPSAGVPDHDATADLLRLDWVRQPLRATPPAGTWAEPRTGDDVSGADVVVVRMLATPGDTIERAGELAERTLVLLRTWLADRECADARLVVVTRGATTGADPAAATVWGLTRSAQTEHPGRIVLVDADGDVDRPTLAAVLAAGHPEVAFRAGAAYVPRLARVAGTSLGAPALDQGTVLVTGASGALGRLVARHLVARHGVQHLVLVSRRGGGADLADELARAGAKATVAACDVTDRDALAQLLAGIPADLPLRGIVHTAGVLDDGVLAALTPERLHRVLAPKVTAAWHLHELTRGLDLAAFVLFSSAAGSTGPAGQANYAAGNAFLDALAAHRHAAGLPAQSLAWGPWDTDGGMVAGLDDAARRRLTAGVAAFTPDHGLAALDAALARPEPVLVPIRVDTAALGAAGDLRPLWQGLVPARRTPRPATTPDLRARLAEQPDGTREDTVLALVRTEVAAVLGHHLEDVTSEQAFTDLGVDSLTAVELRNRLAQATGLRLAASVVFDRPTPVQLARHLLDELTPAGVAAPDDPVAALFRRACEENRISDGMELARVAARLRPVFRTEAELPRRPHPVPLSRGVAVPTLVCFPAVVALSGAHQYARFAAGLRGSRNTVVLPEPGFGAGEPLPAGVDVLLDVQARAVRELAGDTPVALLGYSSGGWIAHAVTSRLAEQGHPPAGLVLIDTYLAGEMTPALQTAFTDGLFARRGRFVSMDHVSLTAMGGYFGTFAGWTPAPHPVAVPTLFVRAADALPGPDGNPLPDTEWGPSWSLHTDGVTTPGDHFSVMEEHAETTARLVDGWLHRAGAPSPAQPEREYT